MKSQNHIWNVNVITIKINILQLEDHNAIIKSYFEYHVMNKNERY